MTAPDAHSLTVPAPSAATSFDFAARTRLIFGPGSSARAGELARELGGRRILLVTDPGIVAAGHAARVAASLAEAGLEVQLFDQARENPTTADVARCVEAARAHQADLLVGLGGGSSMDTAKGCNFILTNGGAMRDYWGVGKATRPMLPLLAIPTTAGTGSECQSAALIADEASHQKMACLDPKAAARVAVLDPLLTVSQPRAVTACTGVDALTHALETAVTRKRNPLSAMFSREAFRLIAPSLPRVLAAPADLEARGRMLLGAAFAGCAIEHSMLGAAHSCANPLTARFGLVHGIAVGLMLPHVMRFNANDPAARHAYAELAALQGLRCETEEVAVVSLLSAVETLLHAAGVPRCLGDAGVPADAIAPLAEEASRQWTAQFNPRPLTLADFQELYSQALLPR
jgi:alcohol dehydrogenase